MLAGPADSLRFIPSVFRAVPSSPGACHDETLVIGFGARRGEVSSLPPGMKEVFILHGRYRLLL